MVLFTLTQFANAIHAANPTMTMHYIIYNSIFSLHSLGFDHSLITQWSLTAMSQVATQLSAQQQSVFH